MKIPSPQKPCCILHCIFIVFYSLSTLAAGIEFRFMILKRQWLVKWWRIMKECLEVIAHDDQPHTAVFNCNKGPCWDIERGTWWSIALIGAWVWLASTWCLLSLQNLSCQIYLVWSFLTLRLHCHKGFTTCAIKHHHYKRWWRCEWVSFWIECFSRSAADDLPNPWSSIRSSLKSLRQW